MFIKILFNYRGETCSFRANGFRANVYLGQTDPIPVKVKLPYRSIQVYQRSYSQVGHRALSDFTLKIVRQNPPRSELESPLSDS
jgi:hypothetical protein